MPALGVGFSYAWTRRLAFEVTVTTMKSPHIVGLDQFEAGAIVYARPITRLNAWLPYVRVAAGVTSDDFTELPSFPMARVGLGAEFTLPAGSSGFPGIRPCALDLGHASGGVGGTLQYRCLRRGPA
jgi:hypothetical protein